MTTDTELLLPPLTNALNHSSKAVRWRAVRSIGQLAINTNIAGPALQSALTDPDRITRSEVTNVLHRLAPELIANTPSQ
jgi:HEAT repeat protein